MFPCSKGVKQGDTLSPLLFNLYINDLPDALANTPDPPLLNDTLVRILLYADDALLLSLSKEGLQSSLDKLSEYCKKWKLEVNLNKTKIMQFNGNGHKCKDKFYLDNVLLENVQSYKYLGVLVCASGSFSLARHQILSKTKKVLFKLKGCLRNADMKPSLGLKLFDQLIKPICTYGSEIWCSDIVPKTNKRKEWFIEEIFYEQPIEHANVSFCKFLLGVNKKSGNMACRSELGRSPIATSILCMIAKFYDHLKSSNHVLIKQALSESTKLYSEKKQSWVSFFKIIEKELNFSISRANKKSLKNHLKKRYTNYWKSTFYNQYIGKREGKFCTYTSLKNQFMYEPYLDQVKNFYDRRALTKLRISNHNLEIEQGRYKKPPIPRDLRFCQFCNGNHNEKVIGDEIHFLLKCPKFNKEREDLLNNQLYQSSPNLRNLNDQQLFCYLMNSEGSLCQSVARFCNTCLFDGI